MRILLAILALSAVTLLANTAASDFGPVDTQSVASGEITLLPTTPISYSTEWFAGDSVEVLAAKTDNPSIYREILVSTAKPEEGVCTWDYLADSTLPKGCTYELQHVTKRGTDVADTKTATVTILPEPVLALALGLLGLALAGRGRRAFLALLLTLALGGAALRAATVDNVTFAQRWPWSGQVDIDFTIESENTYPLVQVVFQGQVGEGAPFALTALSGAGENGYVTSSGSHRCTWDALADGQNLSTDQFRVLITAQDDTAAYMRVDLTDTSSSAITFQAAPPADWSSDSNANKKDYMWFRKIPHGTFMMGSPTNEIGRVAERETEHQVTLTKDFYIGVFETTLYQYYKIIDSSNTKITPVGGVSFNNFRGGNWPTDKSVAQDSAIDKLRNKTAEARAVLLDSASWTFDLPTEAQWEYACKAGTHGTWNDGSPIQDDTADSNLDRLAWYKANSTAKQNVGGKVPNGWGLYDMHGNNWEWCLDWFETDPGADPAVDPEGPTTGTMRVQRGGVVGDVALKCRSAARYCTGPTAGSTSTLGYRLVMVQP